MSQPHWKTVCTVGDVNPVDYSGGIVQVDETGVYAPECTWIEAGESEDDPVRVYRFILEPCTFINGILSDNRFHPDKPAWFAKPESERKPGVNSTTWLKGLADQFNESVEEFAQHFLSDDIQERAGAWMEVGHYHGFDNLDSYPLTMSPDECREWLKGKA
jgi:hypothetical protein